MSEELKDSLSTLIETKRGEVELFIKEEPIQVIPIKKENFFNVFNGEIATTALDIKEEELFLLLKDEGKLVGFVEKDKFSKLYLPYTKKGEEDKEYCLSREKYKMIRLSQLIDKESFEKFGGEDIYINLHDFEQGKISFIEIDPLTGGPKGYLKILENSLTLHRERTQNFNPPEKEESVSVLVHPIFSNTYDEIINFLYYHYSIELLLYLEKELKKLQDEYIKILGCNPFKQKKIEEEMKQLEGNINIIKGLLTPEQLEEYLKRKEKELLGFNIIQGGEDLIGFKEELKEIKVNEEEYELLKGSNNIKLLESELIKKLKEPIIVEKVVNLKNEVKDFKNEIKEDKVVTVEPVKNLGMKH